jgi:hypothetical protein
MKVRKFTYESSNHTQYLYHCLGCGYEHAFALKSEGGHHDWNGDHENPTVSPSLVQNFTPGKMCHSFIRNGMIEYLSDCFHELAGKTVQLPTYQFDNDNHVIGIK